MTYRLLATSPQSLTLLHCLFDSSHHVEGLFGQVIVLASQNFLEAAHGVFDLDKLARLAGEDLSNKEGLGQEALYLAGAGYSQFVVFAQLFHAQNGND